jgi:hypothetical protein
MGGGEDKYLRTSREMGGGEDKYYRTSREMGGGEDKNTLGCLPVYRNININKSGKTI